MLQQLAVVGLLATTGGFTTLVDLTAQRLLLADRVAAAKFGGGGPIDDPVRERQVLDRVTTMAADEGLDSGDAVTFFRAQIESSKVVQRGLFDRWTADPAQAPTTRPDLANEVRPELDRLTGALLGQLRATRELRGPTAGCSVARSFAVAAADRRHHLDDLHEQALRYAVATLCSSPPEG